jgi:2-hydroxychromene-2-carboxylate isomerase
MPQEVTSEKPTEGETTAPVTTSGMSGIFGSPEFSVGNQFYGLDRNKALNVGN